MTAPAEACWAASPAGFPRATARRARRCRRPWHSAPESCGETKGHEEQFVSQASQEQWTKQTVMEIQKSAVNAPKKKPRKRRRAYFSTGLPAFSQALMPPSRLKTLVNCRVLILSDALALRPPAAHC